jgi:tRNA nucleotidyltransferase (CCA-adding enzyme)
MPQQQTWEHFAHQADIGIRGTGATLSEALEQAACAMTAVITDPDLVRATRMVEIRCEAPDPRNAHGRDPMRGPGPGIASG